MAISGSSMESVVFPITTDSRIFEEDYSLDIGEHDPKAKDKGWTFREAAMCRMWNGHMLAVQPWVLQEST